MVNKKELTFKEKLALCNDLVDYFENLKIKGKHSKLETQQINELSNNLKRWKSELGVRKLYYDI